MDNQKRLLFIGGSSLVLFIILTILVSLGITYDFDLTINHYYTSIDNAFLSNSSFIAHYAFGTLGFLIMTFFVCIYLFHKKRKIESKMLALAMSLDVVLVYLIKILIERARPIFHLYPADGFSFPSGHATTSMVFFGIIATILFFNFTKKKERYAISIILGSLIAFIGFTRVYWGVHYFTDIFAGFLLGTSIICGVLYYFKKGNLFFSMYKK